MLLWISWNLVFIILGVSVGLVAFVGFLTGLAVLIDKLQTRKVEVED